MQTELSQSSWIFTLKNEFFDISQLLSKPSKYSFGSKLIIFILESLRLRFFKIPPPRATKRLLLAHFSRVLWQFCAQPISIICTILDSEGKGLSIKKVCSQSKNSTHPMKQTILAELWVISNTFRIFWASQRQVVVERSRILKKCWQLHWN